MATLDAINVFQFKKRSQCDHVSDIEPTGAPFRCFYQRERGQLGPGVNTRTTYISKRVANVFDRKRERMNHNCLAKASELFLVYDSFAKNRIAVAIKTFKPYPHMQHPLPATIVAQ